MPFNLDGQTFYRMSEACKLAGTNRNTVLRWIRQGKVFDVEQRDRNGWRLFTQSDVKRLTDRVNQIYKVVKTL